MTVKATQTRFATNAALRDILQRIISRAHSGNEDDYYSETFGPDFETAAALLSGTDGVAPYDIIPNSQA